MKVDREVDFHGWTRAEMRAWLECTWSRREWLGIRRVRVIHGTGEVLGRELRRWCHEKAIEWTVEPHNPGVTILHPSRRALTPPPPPHRPLTRLRPIRDERSARAPRKEPPTARPTPESPPPPTPPPTPAPSGPDLMAQEFERLAGVDPRVLRRRKNG